MNNSVEATGEVGRVTVSVSRLGKEALIQVSDTGKGISREIQNLIAREGLSYGKKLGSGLGLNHAKEWVRKWGGRLEIVSKVDQGTTVSVWLPVVPAPQWWLPLIPIGDLWTFVSVDDDASIHQVWRSRLEPLCKKYKTTKLYTFSSPNDFRRWYGPKKNRSRIFFLVDYEFAGVKESGIDLIKSFGLVDCSALVTSHFEERSIIETAVLAGISIVPKSMANIIPFAESLASSLPLRSAGADSLWDEGRQGY